MTISKTEASFHRTSLLADSRADGRKRLEYRNIHIETGIAPHSNGSSRVTVGLTEIVVGCRLETVDLSHGAAMESPEYKQKLVDIRVQFSTASSYANPSSVDPSLSLTDFLTDLFVSRLTTHPQLIIVPEKKAWSFIIDVEVLAGGCLGGNLKDVAAIAVKAALCDLRIPKTVSVAYPEDPTSTVIPISTDTTATASNNNDQEDSNMLKDFLKTKNYRPQNARNRGHAADFDLEDYRNPGDFLRNAFDLPLAVEKYTYVDATQEEEFSTPQCRFTVALDPSSTICAIKQEGEVELPIDRMQLLISQATDVCQNLHQAVNAKLKALLKIS